LFDVEFTHWAVYVGRVGVWDEGCGGQIRWIRDTDDVMRVPGGVVECVVHLWGAPDGGDESDDGRNRDMDENASCVLTPLVDVGDDPRCGNARFDALFAPLRIDEIMDRSKLAVDQGFYEGRYGGYCVRANNCEHFATWARYGRRVSEQIETKVDFGLKFAQVAGSLLGIRTDAQTTTLAKHFLMGTRISPDDAQETARAIRDMHDGYAPKYSPSDDVAYVLEYIVDRVDVETEKRREDERRRVSLPWSSRSVPANQTVATISFGRSSPHSAATHAIVSSPRHTSNTNTSSRTATTDTDTATDIPITADQIVRVASHVGAFVRRGAESALHVLGAFGEELEHARTRAAAAAAARAASTRTPSSSSPPPTTTHRDATDDPVP
jgi:hypothetical protein